MVYVQGLELISGKHHRQVSTFRFRAVNLVEKALCFALSLKYAGLCKEYSPKQVT